MSKRQVIGILCYEDDTFIKNWQWVIQEAKRRKIKIEEMVTEIVEFAHSKYKGKLPHILTIKGQKKKKGKGKQVYIQTVSDSPLVSLYAWVRDKSKRLRIPVRDVLNFIITEYRITQTIQKELLNAVHCNR